VKLVKQPTISVSTASQSKTTAVEAQSVRDAPSGVEGAEAILYARDDGLVEEKYHQYKPHQDRIPPQEVTVVARETSGG